MKIIHALLATCCLLLTACGGDARLEDKNTGEKAVKAGTAGALGGLVYGVIMKDDDALRRAAATGAATATVVAASDTMKGPTQGDKQQTQWEAAIGKDNSDAIVHLIKRDYAAARASLTAAAASEDPHVAAASTFLTAVLLTDTGDTDAVRPLMPQLVGAAPELHSTDDVEAKLKEAMKELKKLRKRYGG